MRSVQREWRVLTMQALPMLAGVLVIAMRRQQLSGDTEWAIFLSHIGQTLLISAPLLVAHLAAFRLSPKIALLTWVSTVGLWPVAATAFGVSVLPGAFLILVLLSGLSLMQGRRGRGDVIDILQQLPITLDGAVFALVTIWVFAMSFLFISTPDPVNNQPLSVWFDGARIAAHPLLYIGYLLQFVIMGGLLYSYFWLCRYVLVRHLLANHGWLTFLLGSLAFWILYTPIVCSIVLLLPLNEPHWTAIPSGTTDPFHTINYSFSFALWLLICPIVLVSERLLRERSEVMNSHERVRAELNLLQQQINPHFLFNTLNTLYALCLRDNQASAQAVVKLSDLLRYSVYEGQEEWVGLDNEIEHLRNYLDLQMLRFGTRCDVSTSWPDDAGGHLVPPQMLIMLVENAFKHGVEPSDQPNTLVIDLAVVGQRMCFTCVNRPVTASPTKASAGLGLANLKRRLELLCGDRFVLESRRQGDAWHAELQLDLRRC